MIGLDEVGEVYTSGRKMEGVWFENREAAAAHQAGMSRVPPGRYHGMAVSPLRTGRLDPPDICLFYGNPAQMILFINGLQWRSYKRYDFSITGESEPGLMADVDPARSAIESTQRMPGRPRYLRAVAEGTARFCVVAWPLPGWAQSAYPELGGEAAARAVAEDLLRFTRLSASDQDRVLTSLQAHPSELLRGGFDGVKALVFMGYYRDPRTWSLVGYDGPLLGRG